MFKSEKRTACFLFIVLGTSWVASAACTPSAGAARSLERLAPFSKEPGYNISAADIYVDAKCFAEARELLVRAASNVAREPAANEPSRGERAAILQAYLKYVDARILGERGDLKGEKAALSALRDFPADRIQSQVIWSLARSMLTIPDPPLWAEIQPKLETYLERPGIGWWISALLLNHFQLVSGQPGATDYFIRILAQPHPLQSSLQLRVRLLFCLVTSGRIAEACILTRSIDAEIGRSLLDQQARADFLSLAADAWRMRAASHLDPHAEATANAYQAVLKQAIKEM